MAETPGTEHLRAIHVDQRDKSKGFRTRRGFFNQFSAGPNVKSLYDISLPYAVDLLQGDYWIPATVNPKNRLWVEIAPLTDLALLVGSAGCDGAVVATDTEVVVNAQAKAALDAMLTSNGDMQTEEVFICLTAKPGDEADTDAVTKVRWDSANSKFVSPDGSSQLNLTAADADKIFVTVRWEDGSYLAPGEFVRMGDETLGSSQLPANTKIRFIMLNEDATAVDVGFNLTYLHD